MSRNENSQDDSVSRRGIIRAAAVASASAIGLTSVATAHAKDGESHDGENATESEDQNASESENEDADDETNGGARIIFNDHQTDGGSVTVGSVTMPDGGFVSIHDRRRFEGKVLPSIIGITDFLEPGQYNNVEVPLFTANATAPGPAEGQDQNGLTESQPLIAIPHRDANDSGAFNGEPNPDPAYEGPGTLEELGAVNDIATVFVEGADQQERNQAKNEEQQARDQFSGN